MITDEKNIEIFHKGIRNVLLPSFDEMEIVIILNIWNNQTLIRLLNPYLQSDMLHIHFFLLIALIYSSWESPRQGSWNHLEQGPSHPSQFTVSTWCWSGVLTSKHLCLRWRSQGTAGAVYLETRAHLSCIPPARIKTSVSGVFSSDACACGPEQQQNKYNAPYTTVKYNAWDTMS